VLSADRFRDWVARQRASGAGAATAGGGERT
jgi:hypothetical protein